MSQGSSYGPDVPEATVRVLEAINDTDGVPDVVQNLVPGALAARDAAATAYRQAASAAHPLSKPEYLVVWAGKMTPGDLSGGTLAGYHSSGALSPQALAELAGIGMKPGLDAMVVVDGRRYNVDGTVSESYGKVVNFVQVPPPFGIESEPHHLQYEWEEGQPVVAGGLLNDVTTVRDVSRIPEIHLTNAIRPEETPLGTVPDAYDFLPGGRAIGTYMGGPNFTGASCGGGIFFAPDVTALAGDSTVGWKQVFDDDMAVLHASGDDRATRDRTREDGGCAGGSWHQVSRDNRFLFRTVIGRNPGSTESFDTGTTKAIYSLGIAPLIASAADGAIGCSIDTMAEVRRGQGDEADCPRLLSVLRVEDSTTGGPHWGAIDNHSLTPTGAPTRLVFSNSLVARTGVDGNHRMYMVDVDPATGARSYDRLFRDEKDGDVGVDFNRRNWPKNDDAGFYKPHAMVWVCPPGVCPGSATATAVRP